MSNNDMLSSLKGLLGDNADEKINMVMSALKNSNTSDNLSSVARGIDESIEVNDEKSAIPVSFSQNNNSGLGILSNEGLEYMSKIKNIIDEMGTANDPRSNLLMSLKPYMRTTRQKSIDNAIKILNLSRLSGILKF